MNNLMHTLHTDRLVLRPLRENDAAAMYKNWTYDNRVAKYCRWHPHKSVAETEAYLKEAIDKEFVWAITLAGNDEPIGCVDVSFSSEAVPEIGYALAHDYWKQGLMTEAAGAIIGELFRCGFPKVGACCFEDNPASAHVLEKCGMKHVRSFMELKKHGSTKKLEVKYYEIDKPKEPES